MESCRIYFVLKKYLLFFQNIIKLHQFWMYCIIYLDKAIIQLQIFLFYKLMIVLRLPKKKTEVFFSIQELTQRYSIFQLLTFTQEITFVNLYTNSFALTYLFVSSIKNQSFHTIVESLNGKDMKNMNLEQPKFIFQEISNDVDILPLFYEIFIEVYNNQENLYAMLFHYFANQISSKIKSIENIEWLCRLNPNTPHFKQILINCVENSKLFYKKNETSFDKNEYDVKNIYIIDLTSKDRPSKFTIYE